MKKNKQGISLTVKSYLVVLITLGVFIVIIPYSLYSKSFNVTLYIYVGIISYFLVCIAILKWLAKILRKIIPIPEFNFLDINLTILIIIIAVPLIAVLCIISILILLVFDRLKYIIVYTLATIIIFVLGVRITHEGGLPSKKLGPLIVLANHSSFIDYFLILHTMGLRPYNVVVGKNLSYIWFLAYFLKKYAIGVDRTSEESKIKAYDKMEETIKKGLNVAIFPTDGRIKIEDAENLLKVFKPGAFKLAIETGAMIVPVLFSLPFLYSGKSDKKKWLLKPQNIEIIYCDPISPVNMTRRELKEKTREIMLKKLNELKKVKNFLNKTTQKGS